MILYVITNLTFKWFLFDLYTFIYVLIPFYAMIVFVYQGSIFLPKKKGAVMEIPKDPFILLSFINLKLRDEYDSLENLCLDLQLNKEELCQKLQAAGFEYQESQKQFR